MTIRLLSNILKYYANRPLQRCLLPPYKKDGNIHKEIHRSYPIYVFFVAFLPCATGIIGSILIALVFNEDEISNYNWQCGRARLPSLSRIINLPFERALWQLVILFHVPFRILDIHLGVRRFTRLRQVNCIRPNFYTLMKEVYFYTGFFEIVMLVGLSIIGERENIRVHVILFYIFGVLSMVHFAANIYCHRYSYYYLKPHGNNGFRLKILFFFLYVGVTPILCGSFFLYWKQCITIAYDIFAITEYFLVIMNIGFHCLTVLDLRHKLIVSFRIVRTYKERPCSCKYQVISSITTPEFGRPIDKLRIPIDNQTMERRQG